MNVIPSRCLFHSVALLPDIADPRRFLAAADKRIRGIAASAAGWKAVPKPRAVAFGELSDGDWRWHVVIDLDKVPDVSWRPGFGDTKPPQHRSHAFTFLLEAPKSASGLDRARRGLQLSFAWLDAGATHLGFPTGGILEPEASLRGVDPSALDADKAAGLLVSYALMGQGRDGRAWLRTRGMSQFGLADLCCALPGMPVTPAGHLEAVQTLFSSLAPYLVSLDRTVNEGETVQIGKRVWKALPQSALEKAPAYYGELRPFELTADEAAS